MSDVRQSDLVNKHIKRGIIILIYSIQLKKLNSIDSIKFNLIQFDSRFIASRHLCIQRCVYDLKYIRCWSQTCCGNSTIKQKLDSHKFGGRDVIYFFHQIYGNRVFVLL